MDLAHKLGTVPRWPLSTKIYSETFWQVCLRARPFKLLGTASNFRGRCLCTRTGCVISQDF